VVHSTISLNHKIASWQQHVHLIVSLALTARISGNSGIGETGKVTGGTTGSV
jgi:hypothetical protein